MTDAIRSHGTQLQMGDGSTSGVAKDITSTTAGDPLTLVTATSHGFSTGDVVTIAGVTGVNAVAVNGVGRRVIKVSANQFAVEVVTTGAGAGSGTATPAAEAFTTVAMVGDIAGPAYSRDNIDATTHDSPLDYEELVATIKKSGEISFPVFWEPTDPTHDASTGLFAAYEDGVTRNWKLVLTDYLSDPSELRVTGYVSGFAAKAPVAGLLGADVRIQVTGASVYSKHGS